MDTSETDLFFQATVDRYLTSRFFVSRDWLVKEVELLLADPNCRFVVLTAEPGAGKSAFAAQFVHEHSADETLVYFIRRDQVARLDDVSAIRFFLRIGLQLAAKRPELFDRDQLQIDIEQQIGRMSEGSEAVGAELARVWTDPFYRQVIRVRQVVSQADGTLAGLRIGEVVVSEYALAPGALLEMALARPARILARLSPGARVVVVVDGLDEEQYSPDREPTIMRTLANLPELPHNVRFVLTSRSTTPLELFVKKHVGSVKAIGIDPADGRVQGDLHRFVAKIIKLPEIASLFAGEWKSLEDFVARAILKADGNIGYLDALARAILRTLEEPELKSVLTSLMSLSELPDGLRGLYGFFLLQIKSLVDGDAIIVDNDETGMASALNGIAWSGLYMPVLATLAIAREPLKESQLKALSGCVASEAAVVRAVEQLRQFLDPVAGCYRLYHTTLGEFLTSPSTLADPATRELYVDQVKQNRQLALRLEGKAGTALVWDDSTVEPEPGLRRDYARRHLIAHMFLGNAWDRLFAAIDDGYYGHGKLCYDPSGFSYAQDLDMARAACQRNGLSIAEAVALLPRLWKYSVLRCSLASGPEDYAPGTFGVMAGLGSTEEAERRLDLVGVSELQAVGFAKMAKALSGNADQKCAVKRLLCRAIDSASQMYSKPARVKSLLAIAKLLPPIVVDSSAEGSVLGRLVQAARELDDPDPIAQIMARAGSLLRQCGNDDAARAILTDAENVLTAIIDAKERNKARALYAETLSAMGDIAGAVTVASRLEADLAIPGRAFAVRVMVAAGEDSTPLLQDLRHEFAALPSAAERALSAESMASALHAVGAVEEACEVLDEARDVANELETYCSLAMCSAFIDRHDKAAEAIADAVAAADREEASIVRIPFKFYTSPYRPVIEALAGLGLWSEALSRARALKTGDRDYALGIAIKAMIAAGKIDRALEVERDLENMDGQLFTFSISPANRDDELSAPDSARKALVLALARNDRTTEAIQLAMTGLRSPKARAITFAELAEELLQAGSNALARTVLLAQAKDLQTRKQGRLHQQSLKTIARLLIEGEVWSCAKKALARTDVADWEVTQALQGIQDPNVLHDLMTIITDDGVRAGLATNFAHRLTSQGESAQALAWLDVAEKFALGPKGRTISTLDGLCDCFSELGKHERAAKLFNEANALRRTLSRQLLPGPIADIAIRYAKAGDWGQFDRMVREELSMQERPFAFAQAACAAAEAGKIDRALALTDSAIAAAAGLPEPGNSFGLDDVVRCYAKLGTWGAALALLSRNDLSFEHARDELAIQMIDRGRRSEAIDFARAEPGKHRRTIVRLAHDFVSEGALAEAGLWIELIEEDSNRHDVEVRLSLAMAPTNPALSTERLAAAWHAALGLRDTRLIPSALQNVSDALVAIGRLELALELVQNVWLQAADLDRLGNSLEACSSLVLKFEPKLGCGLLEGLDWCTAFLDRDRERKLRPLGLVPGTSELATETLA